MIGPLGGSQACSDTNGNTTKQGQGEGGAKILLLLLRFEFEAGGRSTRHIFGANLKQIPMIGPLGGSQT